MSKFAQTQSTPISNMVAELNAVLGAQHFRPIYYNHNRMYELQLTEIGKASKKFSYLATEGCITFAEMFHYLNGILMGYRVAKQINNL